MTHVLIVEDERLIQELFARYIGAARDRYILAETTADAANAALICQNTEVDLVLMDVCTANDSSGLDAAAAIKRRFPAIKIIIVTSAPEYRFLQKARSAGADSFWYKEIGEAELLEVMDRTMAGESIYPDKTPAVTIGGTTSDDFTRTEMEVLRYLAEGISSRSIAERMHITADTVNTHIKHLKEKTGCTSKTQLAVLASKARLVMPEY